ncbi:MAG: class II D-tagatose-bisphosphate aldolase, non-catalytic subunit [Nitratireductor sp.]|nr:class II D-tagatose-bisphosphate aldolase, non-catalytic subunit [Nitratireductor sp.]
MQRHFILSDRIRYYWPQPSVVMAVEELTRRLGEREIPAPVLHQYFPELGIRSEPATAHDLLLGSVRQVLELYEKAT